MTSRTTKFLAAATATVLAFAATAAMANPRFKLINSGQMQPLSTDFTMGNKKAPVVMIEYASLTCPHCAHFHKDVLPALTKEFVDKGKMLYILRPYPLNEPALKAAELVDCVGENTGSERYYTFVRVLFETQTKWAFDANWSPSLATIARVGGVSADTYEKCTTDPKREIKILTTKRNATNELGLDHTPGIYINGHEYDDEVTPAKLSAYINKVMTEAPVKQDGKKSKPAKADSAPATHKK